MKKFIRLKVKSSIAFECYGIIRQIFGIEYPMTPIKKQSEKFYIYNTHLDEDGCVNLSNDSNTFLVILIDKDSIKEEDIVFPLRIVEKPKQIYPDLLKLA